MTTNHIFYIPLMLVIGVLIGFTLGKRAAAGEAERNERKARRKALREKAFERDGKS